MALEGCMVLICFSMLVRDMHLKPPPFWLAFASVVSPGWNVFAVLLQKGPLQERLGVVDSELFLGSISPKHAPPLGSHSLLVGYSLVGHSLLPCF